MTFTRFCIIFIAMKRDIYNHLLNWKQSPQRKPLVLRGARQVGKTHILKEFGANEYENVIRLNFEDDPTLDAVFAQRFDKQRIISYLSAYGGVNISPGKTLLIFDEVQASNSALNSLKNFRENANEYHVAAAGSLLGIKLEGQKSFPVGQVNFLDLYPMSFPEFLDAVEKPALRRLIEESQGEFTPFPEPFHVELIEILKHYYLTGGMPEAVSTYCQTRDFNITRQVQHDIIDSYLLDFSKHAEKSDVMKISEIWRSVPAHLSKENKKFIFSALKKSARARDYERALQWLVDAGIIYKVYNLSTPKLPLSTYSNAAIFKVYLHDIGLLGAMAGMSPDLVLKGSEVFTHFHGALVENYVAQQLKGKFRGDLFYWTSSGKAEVDFVFHGHDRIFPLEAKAGVNLKSKSLKVYSEKYNPEILSRTSLRNLDRDGKTCNYPLYAISLFPIISKPSPNASPKV
ncbi:MAG: ATP-binding protein [bacterium]|nr:ATP-binding protein [bacterium]